MKKIQVAIVIQSLVIFSLFLDNTQASQEIKSEVYYYDVCLYTEADCPEITFTLARKMSPSDTITHPSSFTCGGILCLEGVPWGEYIGFIEGCGSSYEREFYVSFGEPDLNVLICPHHLNTTQCCPGGALSDGTYHCGECQTNTGCAMTAIYGEHSAETELLRSLRDNILSKSPEGKKIIKLYYEWSPTIVRAMEDNEGFRKEVKELIDEVLSLMEFSRI